MFDEIRKDIWQLHEDGAYIVIPTNGSVKRNGECVMGRGLAFQASNRFQNLAQVLGTKIMEAGNVVHAFLEYRLYTFPVKNMWQEDADLGLIERSLQQLVGKARLVNRYPVALPRVGCGNGRLAWEDVKPVLEKYLDENFVVAYSPEHESRPFVTRLPLG